MSDERRGESAFAAWLEEFRPSREESALYQRAAGRSGLETAHWARQTLSRAAWSLLDPATPRENARNENPDFEGVFAAVPTPLLLLAPDNPTFTILAANDAYLRATMTGREEIVGRGLFDVFPDNPDDPDATGASMLRASLERALANRRPDTMAVQKYDIPLPPGLGGGFEERHWSPINTPVLDDEGRITCIIHRAEDVTEVVMLERMDKRREAMADSFRALAGERQLEIMRRAREIAQARDILQKEFACQTSDLEELSREVARRGQELNQALEQLRAREELQRFLADATALLAESLDLRETLSRVVRLSIPVFADWCILDLITDNHIERTDVAHADPADAEVAEGARRYRAAFDKNQEYPATRVLLGRGPVLIEAVDDEAARAIAQDEQHLALLRASGLRSIICVALMAHGRTLGFLTFSTSRSGRTYNQSHVVIAQDIARRCALAIENAQLFEESRNALRVRDQFLSVASHELRTPLTPLQLQVEALERKFSEFVKAGKESWLEDRLTSIRRQAGRLEHLVEDLLEMSHIVEGSIRIQPEPLDLGELTRTVVSRFRQDHPDQVIHVDLGADLAGRWDRERLGQVLTYLLTNARRYGDGHPITLRAFQDGGRAVVAVSDHRAGLAPKDHRRVARVGEDAGFPDYGGLGLGLFVTRQILDAMGGVIEASSGPGLGATFTVRLPLHTPAALGTSDLADSPMMH